MTERKVSSERLPERCPHCDLHWGYNPPAMIAGTDKVRCIHCKSVFDFPVSSERVSEERLPTRNEAARAAEVLLRCNGHDLDVWGASDLMDDAPMDALKALTAALKGDRS